MPLHDILRECGLPGYRSEPVLGGDINRAYCLYSGNIKYFLKVNNAGLYPGMFEKEASGLEALQQNCPLTIPQVIKSGVNGQEQYLLLQWLEKGNPKTGFWQNLGAGLAQLHQKQSTCFGWPENNFIGSLEQYNRQQTSWHLFYGECRVMPLVKDLFNTGAFSKQDLSFAELFCKTIEQRFPLEPAALLHGDLWSGNYMVTGKGCAAIFDPAVYYGHREMDIGMTSLFGGFDHQFYDAYNDLSPLEKGWQQRLPLTQLYPLLVHAVLFGAPYVQKAREILRY